MVQNAKLRSHSSQFLTDSFQRGLANWNQQRLSPQFPAADWQQTLDRDHHMLRLEGGFIEELRGEIAEDIADLPTNAEDFLAWFEGLKSNGPGQNDPLFPWLEEQATIEEFRWFMEQEAAGEAGFDDLVAYTQVKLPTSAKLELARNYWDEMGQGREQGMHGPMLQVVADALNVGVSIETTVWESLALANAMTAMATTRRYTWQSVGALGVVELTAPTRAGRVAKGLKRLGFSAHERRYFDLHAFLDIKHSADWNREVLIPAVQEDSSRARHIAEGALIRLRCGERCFDRYRAEFGLAATGLAISPERSQQHLDNQKQYDERQPRAAFPHGPRDPKYDRRRKSRSLSCPLQQPQ